MLQYVPVARWLLVTWAGGGNVNPALCLAGRLAGQGHRVGAVAGASLTTRLEHAEVAVVGTAPAWLPGAEDVLAAVDRFAPDALIVDYMLTCALCGAEAAGLPTVALVHTLYTALLADGAPHPMGMAGPVDAVNMVRAGLGLASVGGHGELLSAADLVLVAAPRRLDAPGPVPANVVYGGALFEGPGDQAAWRPPHGEGPLVVVSMGTAGDAATESPIIGRIATALGRLPVRGLVTLPEYIDASTVRTPSNVSVTGYLPHAAVLPHADLLVTHAGLGSVLAALAYGVRMVCLPLGRDQPDNARAVARIGAGTELPAEASPDAIAAAVTDQLVNGDRIRIGADPAPAVAALEALLARTVSSA